MTVLLVLGVMVALAADSFIGVQRRSQYLQAVADVTGALSVTRAEASGRGQYTAHIVDTKGGRFWGVEATSDFDLEAFDPDEPGQVIQSGDLPSSVSFAAPARGITSLPVPFAKVPVRPSDEPNLPHCSFCLSEGDREGWGAIVFSPGGRLRFSDGSDRSGQQLMVHQLDRQIERTSVIAVLARTGVSQAFER